MTALSSPACRSKVARTLRVRDRHTESAAYTALVVCLLGALTGCHAIDLYTPSLQTPVPAELAPPRELSMMSLPTYRIEPPDILQIEVLKLVPRSPYRIETYDVLQIRVLGTILDQPIDGYFLVEGEGIVSLGPAYGTVWVAGMTIDEATTEVTRHLQTVLQRPDVSIQLARSAGTQQITGTYLVQPDGMLNLLQFGMVHVAGKTVAEVRLALERQIAQYFDSPQVAVDVVGYHSKSYYVITAQAEMGESVLRFPISGNETVLDAIGQIQGLSHVSSKTMWVSRATPVGAGCAEVLPVDWLAITRGGVTDTNYQLLPGDRIYIVDDKLVATNNYLAKVTQPIERLLNISLLGTNTVGNMQTLGRSYNQNRSGF
jgi:polysaccharide biosynthesis/export protein